MAVSHPNDHDDRRHLHNMTASSVVILLVNQANTTTGQLFTLCECLFDLRQVLQQVPQQGVR